ncbi:MAG: hypothetical protein AAGA95_00945 [Pseudomonadota bacterium]
MKSTLFPLFGLILSVPVSSAAEFSLGVSGARCSPSDFSVPDSGFVRFQLQRIVEPAIKQADIDSAVAAMPDAQRVQFKESMKPRERMERVVLDTILANSYVESLADLSAQSINRCDLALSIDGRVVAAGTINEPLRFGRLQVQLELGYLEAKQILEGDERVFIFDPHTL